MEGFTEKVGFKYGMRKRWSRWMMMGMRMTTDDVTQLMIPDSCEKDMQSV